MNLKGKRVFVKKDIIEKFVLNEDESLIISKDFFFQKNTSAEIIIKAVVGKNSTFEYHPKIIIPKGAKNVLTNLSIKCLLIDETSNAIVEPSMEIGEDEVVASHGASIGKISEEEKHYLLSRGITESDAIKILVDAFIID